MPNRPYPIEYIENETEYIDEAEDSVACFDFKKYKYPFQRINAIRHMRKQVDEVALFLAGFHARSLGKQSSFLFPLVGVQICNNATYGGSFRRILYSNRVLLIGDDFGYYESAKHGVFKKGTVLSHKRIAKEWKSGEILRRSLRWNIVVRKLADWTWWSPFWEDYQTSRDALHLKDKGVANNI